MGAAEQAAPEPGDISGPTAPLPPESTQLCFKLVNHPRPLLSGYKQFLQTKETKGQAPQLGNPITEPRKHCLTCRGQGSGQGLGREQVPTLYLSGWTRPNEFFSFLKETWPLRLQDKNVQYLSPTE